MALALSSSSFSNIKRQISQWEATTGRKATPEMIQSLMEAQLEVSASKAIESERLGLAERQVALQEKTAADDLALKQRAQGLAETNAERSFGLAQQQFGLQQRAFEAQESAAKTSGKIQLASTALQGAMMLGSGGTGGGLAGALGMASGGVGAAALNALGPVGLGVTLGGAVGGKTGSIIGGGAAGFAAGTALGGAVGASVGGGMGAAALGAVGGPVGLVVGAVLGAVSGGSIICTHLYNKKLLSLNELVLSVVLRRKFVSPEVYDGYLIIAKSMLKHRENKAMQQVMLILAKNWLSNAGRDSLRLSTKLGVLVCKAAYLLNRE